MKKVLTIVLVFIMSATALYGCAKKDANGNTIDPKEQEAVETVVRELLDGYKSADENTTSKLGELINTGVINADEELSKYNVSELMDIFSSSNQNFTQKALENFSYTINEVTISDNTATAKVSITNSNLDDLLSEVLKNYTSFMADPSSLESYINDKELTTFTTEGEIVLTKSDDAWEATSVNENFADGILFGVLSWARAFVNNSLT